MGYVCKGMCNRLERERIPNGSKYEFGQKRCTLCSLFMTVSGFRCPCCSALLRTKPRGKRS